MSNFDYYGFRIKTVTNKISEEILFFEGTEYAKVPPINKYLLYLKNRIGADRVDDRPMAHYDNLGNRFEIKKLNMDEYAKDMDAMVFKKPWNKLKEFHKTMKIKEFVNGLVYGKIAKPKDIAKNREYLRNEICGGLKTKKFSKNKSEIMYDQDKMCIQSISSLSFNKKTGLYEIDWSD